MTRTTLNLDDGLVAEATRLTGITTKTELVHAGLRELIARAAGRALGALGGTESKFEEPPRRRAN